MASQRTSTIMDFIANTRGASGPINQMGRVFNEMVNGAERDGKRMGSMLIGIGGNLTIAGSAMQGAFRPVTGFFEDTIKVGMEFERQMATTMGVFEDGVARQLDLMAAATDVGTRYALSNVEAAEALEVFGKAGRTTDEAISELEPVVKLAEANNMDLAKAAQIVAVTMTQFGDAVGGAEEVTNVLNAAAFASTASVEQMGTTFNHAGGIAAGLGVPFGEFATILAVLSNNGIDAMKAGTAYRGIMTRLIAPTKEARQELDRMNISIYEQGQEGEASVVSMKNFNAQLADFKANMPDEQATASAQAALESLGISSVDSTGDMLVLNDMLGILKQEMMKVSPDDAAGLQRLDDAFAHMGVTIIDTTGKLKSGPEIFQQLAEATDGMTEAQRNSVLQTLGMAPGINALNALLGTSEQEWTDMFNTVNDGGASLDNITNLTQSTVPYALEVLRGNLETLKTEIYNELRPVILNIIQQFLRLVDTFRNASPEAKRFVIGLLAVAAAIGGIVGPAIIVIGLLTLALQGLAVTFAPLIGIVAALALVFLALKDRTKEIVEAIQPAIAAWNLLKATFTGGLSEGETSWLDRFIDFIGDVLIGAIHKAARAFQILVDSIVTIRQVLNGTWESGEGIHPFTNAVGVATQFLLRMWPVLVNIVSAMWDFITVIRDSAFGEWAAKILGFTTLGLTLIGVLLSMVGAVAAFGLGLAKLVFAGPIRGIQKMNQALNLFGKGFGGADKAKDKHRKNLGDLEKDQKKTTKSTNTLGQSIKNLAKSFGTAIFSGFDKMLSGIGKAASKAANEIDMLVSRMIQASKQKFVPTPSNISGGGKAQNFADRVITITQHFVTTGVVLLDKIKAATNKTITTTQNFFTTGKVWLNDLKNKTVKITQNFISTGDNLLSGLKDKTIEVKMKVSDADLGKQGSELAGKFSAGFLGGMAARLAPSALIPLFTRLFAPLAPVLLGIFSGPAGWIGLLVAGIVALIALFIANPEWLGIIGDALAKFFTQTLPYAIGAITAEVLNFGLKFIALLLDGLIKAAPFLMEGIVYALAAPFYLAFQALLFAADILGAVVGTLMSILGQAFLIVALDVPRLLIAVGGAIVGGLIESLAAALSLAIDIITSLFLIIPGAIFDAITESGLGGKLGKFFDQLFSLDIGGAIRTGLDILKTLFFQLPGDIIENIGDRFGKIGELFTDFIDEIKDIWEGRFGDILDAVGNFVGDVGGRFENIRDTVGELVGEIADKFTEWYDKVVEIAQGIADAFEDPMGAVLDFLGGFWDEVNRGFEEHFGSSLVGLVGDKWEELKQTVIDKAQAMWDDAKEKLQGLKDDAITRATELKDDVLTRWEELKTQALEKYEALKSEALTKFDELRDQAETKAGELKTKVETKIEELKNNSVIKFGLMVSEIFSALVSIISEGPGTILGLFNILKDSAIRIVTGIATGMIGAGMAIVMGIKNGIQWAIDNLNPLGPLKTLAEEAINIWKTVTMSKSPSKVFMREGQYIVQGVAIGLGQNHKAVFGQVYNLATGTISAFERGFAIASPSQAMVDIAHALIDGLIVGMEEKEIELAKTIADAVKTVIDAMSTLIEFTGTLNATDIIPLDPSKLQELTNGIMLVLNQFSDALAGWSIESLEALGKKLDPAKESVDILSNMLGLLVEMGENASAFTVPLSRFGDLKLALERALVEFKLMYDAFGTDLVDGAVAATRNATIVTDALNGIVEVLAELTDNRAVGRVNLEVFGHLKLAIERAMIEFDLMFKFLGTELITNAVNALDNATNITDALLGIVEVMVELAKNANIGNVNLEVIGQLKLAIERAMIELDLMFRFLGQDLVDNAGAAAESVPAVMDALSSTVDFLINLVDLLDAGRAYAGIVEQKAIELSDYALRVVNAFAAAAGSWNVDLNPAVTAFSEAVEAVMGPLSDTVDFLVTLAEGLEQINQLTRVQIYGALANLVLVSRTTVDLFTRVAQDWNVDITPVLESFGTAVEASMKALQETVGFLVDLIEATTLTDMSVREISAIAQKLSLYARAIAEAFKHVARDWDATVNPSIEDFSKAAQDSISVMADIGDALEAMMTFGEKKKLPDFKKLATALSNIVRIIVDAITEVSHDFETVAMEALGIFADNAGKAVSLVGDVADAMEAMTEMSKITLKQVQIYKANFQVILDLIVDLKAMAEGYLDEAIEFAEIAQHIADALKAANEAIQEVTGEANKAESSGGGSGGGGKSMGVGFNALKDAADDAIKSVQQLKTVYDVAMNGMVNVTRNQFLPTLQEVYRALDVPGDFRHELHLIAHITNETIGQMLVTMQDGGGSIAEALVSGFRTGKLKLETILNATKQMTQTQFLGLMSGLLKLKEGFTTELANALMNGTDPSAASANLNALKALLQSLGVQVNAFAEETTRGAKRGAKSLTDAWGSAKTEMDAVGQNLMRSAGAGINKNSKEVIGEAVTASNNTIKGVKKTFGISSPSTVFTKIGVDIITGLTNGIRSSHGHVMSTLQSFSSMYMNNWRSRIHQPALRAAQDMGRAITDGLAASIRAGQSKVVQAAVAVVKAAIKAAEDAAGIASPSKEFGIIGNAMIKGLTDAIYDGTRDVERSIQTVTHAAIDAARSANLPELTMALKSGVVVPNLDTSMLSSQLQTMSVGGIQPGYMNNTGNVVGTITVGDININSVNDPEYDGHAAGLAVLSAIQEAMQTRKK